ncbi:MAG: tRNA (N6-isopentenyl adenosine(37)-C2)-methylthiotransferase MiaB [Candidatus Magnetomorum sp.]|nr:tRNA (N6-isopentenyl adenosine(37)-C2)-methylthiotransferase MiaB [Candidatus Magnetomorum sp.]
MSTNQTRHILIQTYGCQMNVYDTEIMWRLLHPLGYRAAASEKTADIILINTCAIREKAEQKVFSFLGRLALLKQNRPQLIIGICGCIAQNQGKTLIQRSPCIDFVVGTHALFQLPSILDRVWNGQHRQKVYVDFEDHLIDVDLDHSPIMNTDISGFVTIMRGCNNYCAYCVVPYVRGREMSRPSDNIINEIKHKVSKGMREVTLLGQNVNSYGKREGMVSFSALLAEVNEIKDLLRIRFTTSHPKDLDMDLMDAFANLEKLCAHIHLPVQSGSDQILKRMNRKYTRKEYLAKIDRLKNKCPDISITSDFIVGFPGETREDFDDSLSLIRDVEYDSLFAFQYSDRDIAPASQFFPKVDDKIKRDRLIELLDVQSKNTLKRNDRCIGQCHSVLVEGKSKRDTDQWTGRTSGNKIVNFIAPETTNNLNAFLVDVFIEEACAHSLRGYLCHMK